jgi:hypothetical protein
MSQRSSNTAKNMDSTRNSQLNESKEAQTSQPSEFKGAQRQPPPIPAKPVLKK